jgi:hypothetical protein
MDFRLLPFALVLIVSASACSHSDSSVPSKSGTPSDAELDQINESALPAASEAEVKQLEQFADKIRVLKSPHAAAVKVVRGSDAHLPGYSTELSQEMADKVSKSCSLVLNSDPNHLRILGTNGCPLDLQYDRDEDMKANIASTGTKVSVTSKVGLAISYLSEDIQASTGFKSFSLQTQVNGSMSGSNDSSASGLLRYSTQIDVIYSLPDRPQHVTARLVGRIQAAGHTSHQVERAYITYDGKTFVVTYFEDKAEGAATETRLYIGNKKQSWTLTSFGLPAPLFNSGAGGLLR